MNRRIRPQDLQVGPYAMQRSTLIPKINAISARFESGETYNHEPWYPGKWKERRRLYLESERSRLTRRLRIIRMYGGCLV